MTATGGTGTGETLLAGKFKSPQEMEQAYRELESQSTRRNQAFGNVKTYLGNYGYQVGDDGQIVAPEAEPEPSAERTPPPPAEVEWSSPGEERLAKELAELKGVLQGIIPVLETTTQGVSEPEKAKMLGSLPPDQHEQAAGKWDTMVRALAPAQRNPRNLALIRRAIVGEYAESRGQWWQPQPGRNDNQDVSNAALDAGGNVEAPGPERTAQTDRQFSALNMQVQQGMAAALASVGIKADPTELAKEAEALERERRR